MKALKLTYRNIAPLTENQLRMILVSIQLIFFRPKYN